MAEEQGEEPPNKLRKVALTAGCDDSRLYSQSTAPERIADNSVESPAVNNSLMCPPQILQGTGLAQLPTADLEKRQDLIPFLLYHAHKCQNGACNLPHCQTMKNALNHSSTCTAAETCQVALCGSSQQIFLHWENWESCCLIQDCPLCLPFKPSSEYKRLTAKLQGLNTVYEALGLTLENVEPRLQQYNSISFGETSAFATSMTAKRNYFPKEWHQRVTPDLRGHLVLKLVVAIFPTPIYDLAALRDPRMAMVVWYARKVEADKYETANSREEYYDRLAEKINKVREELRGKQHTRIYQQLRGSLNLEGEEVVSRQPKKGSVGPRPESENSYKMSAKPLGLAVIINNETYETQLKLRKGSKEDVETLMGIFSDLQLEVEIHQDVEKAQLVRILECVSKRDHSKYDCFVLCILSHGRDEDMISCIDGDKVGIDEVLEFFNNVDCKTLAGKPKIFLFETCRGPNIDSFPLVEETDEQLVARDNKYAHYLVVNSTVPNYKSHKFRDGMSLFVLGLEKGFQERSKDEDLMGIMGQVIKSVSGYCIKSNDKTFAYKQTPEIRSTLQKKVVVPKKRKNKQKNRRLFFRK